MRYQLFILSEDCDETIGGLNVAPNGPLGATLSPTSNKKRGVKIIYSPTIGAHDSLPPTAANSLIPSYQRSVSR